MTQKIKILDHHEAIKIAAGEVVERPAHIIKELIENSIDAQAKNINLYLQQAGKKKIVITDDGCGMSAADAQLCFAHHATSKISTVNDLPLVQTYGFRGEALSSIAAVSRVELITKLSDEKLASKVRVDFGQLELQEPCNHATGTTFSITDLFENIPARKKFLKSDETEWNLIVAIIQAFGLRYPEITFKVFHNDYLAYHCPATSNLKNRCAQLWDNQLFEQLLEIPVTTRDQIRVQGLISNLHYFRFNRGQIFTFVNHRWVKNQELSKAILKGYQGALPPQKFPAAFLFVDIDPELIDINVHPKKEEIKFLNPGIVQKLVEQAVQDCLKNNVEQKLQITGPVTLGTAKIVESLDQKIDLSRIIQNLPVEQKIADPSAKKIDHVPFNFASQPLSDLFDDMATSSLPLQQPFVAEKSEIFDSENPQPSTVTVMREINQKIQTQPEFRIVGQLQKTYILVEKPDQFLLIDQHAAHERILYERFLSQATQVSVVHLLFPHLVKLSMQDVALLTGYQNLFAQQGIIFEEFSAQELVIQATPVPMTAVQAQEILQKVLSWLSHAAHLDATKIGELMHEKIIVERACKSAFKAGDVLNQEQMINLLFELQKVENNFCCPHGRPTMWPLSMTEIEKKFKRDYTGAKDLNIFF